MSVQETETRAPDGDSRCARLHMRTLLVTGYRCAISFGFSYVLPFRCLIPFL
jgi:hypothetical protein